MLGSKELRTVAKVLRVNGERSLAAHFERKADKLDQPPGEKRIYRRGYINNRIKLRVRQ
jgi:hypothetical protein